MLRVRFVICEVSVSVFLLAYEILDWSISCPMCRHQLLLDSLVAMNDTCDMYNSSFELMATHNDILFEAPFDADTFQTDRITSDLHVADYQWLL